jgi:hypothetical protein
VLLAEMASVENTTASPPPAPPPPPDAALGLGCESSENCVYFDVSDREILTSLVAGADTLPHSRFHLNASQPSICRPLPWTKPLKNASQGGTPCRTGIPWFMTIRALTAVDATAVVDHDDTAVSSFPSSDDSTPHIPRVPQPRFEFQFVTSRNSPSPPPDPAPAPAWLDLVPPPIRVLHS